MPNAFLFSVTLAVFKASYISHLFQIVSKYGFGAFHVQVSNSFLCLCVSGNAVFLPFEWKFPILLLD